MESRVRTSERASQGAKVGHARKSWDENFTSASASAAPPRINLNTSQTIPPPPQPRSDRERIPIPVPDLSSPKHSRTATMEFSDEGSRARQEPKRKKIQRKEVVKPVPSSSLLLSHSSSQPRPSEDAPLDRSLVKIQQELQNLEGQLRLKKEVSTTHTTPFSRVCLKKVVGHRGRSEEQCRKLGRDGGHGRAGIHSSPISITSSRSKT